MQMAGRNGTEVASGQPKPNPDQNNVKVAGQRIGREHEGQDCIWTGGSVRAIVREEARARGDAGRILKLAS